MIWTVAIRWGNKWHSHTAVSLDEAMEWANLYPSDAAPVMSNGKQTYYRLTY